jgi:hypothetical protein
LENLGWKVVPLLSAERALCGNPRIRHGAYRGRDVLTALLAADREVAVPNLRKTKHERQYRRRKGEYSIWIPFGQISETEPELHIFNYYNWLKRGILHLKHFNPNWPLHPTCCSPLGSLQILFVPACQGEP